MPNPSHTSNNFPATYFTLHLLAAVHPLLPADFNLTMRESLKPLEPTCSEEEGAMERSRIRYGLKTMILMLTMMVIMTACEMAGPAGNCTNFDAKVEEQPWSYNAYPNTITKVAVKAKAQVQGLACFIFLDPPKNQNNGCYQVRGLGSSTVMVNKIGSDSVCKDISHIELSFGDPVATNADTAEPEEISGIAETPAYHLTPEPEGEPDSPDAGGTTGGIELADLFKNNIAVIFVGLALAAFGAFIAIVNDRMRRKK